MSGSVLFTLAALLHCSALAQVIPDEYTIGHVIQVLSNLVSTNGSLSDRRCKETTASTSRCDILFDGLVPNLTSSDFLGDMWASELLTFNNGLIRSTILNLQFNSPTALEMVEIVMFNCPQWGIGVDTARIVGVSSNPLVRPPTSCDSLVSLCLPVADSTRLWTSLTIEFNLRRTLRWIHLAEVKISENGSNFSCPSLMSGAMGPPVSPTTLIAETPIFTSETTVDSTIASTEDNSLTTVVLASAVSALAAIIFFITTFSVLLVVIYKCCRQRKLKNVADSTGCPRDCPEAAIDNEVEYETFTSTEYSHVGNIGLVRNQAYNPHSHSLQQLPTEYSAEVRSIGLVRNQAYNTHYDSFKQFSAPQLDGTGNF